jgi:hypothetical protein
MNIRSIDSFNNLFSVTNAVPDELVKQIINTDWMSLEYTKQEMQETWPRRRVKNSAISWIGQWEDHFCSVWEQIINSIQHSSSIKYAGYIDTAFWIDEPGFDCAMHTDGQMPGAMQLYWIGDADQGTTFYHSNKVKDLRHQFEFVPNSGYIAVRDPQWHAMLTPVRPGQFRLSSYSWIEPAWS